MVRTISLIGAPSSAGAYGPGQEAAPAALRRHGIVAELGSDRRKVVDRGDGPVVHWRRDQASPTAANADLVVKVARTLAEAVAKAFADDHDMVVLGRDCTVELGTVAGAIRDGASVGLAYVDLDADLKTPLTGDGILDWMGVAHIVGAEGTHAELASLAGRRPMLVARAVRLFATKNITDSEQRLIDDAGIEVEPLQVVTDSMAAVASRTGEWAGTFDRLLVHVDVDVLDFEKFPIAENTDHRGGLDLSQLTELLVMLCRQPNWRALTLCEVNPDHAPDPERSIARIVDMLAEALG
ncbi:MAG: arginase family protein [Acidimicrobiia bacterium]|nr:arginase family protein [Acidimicrobiia bacterium]